MRVTNNMLVGTVLNNLNRNLRQLNKLQNQMSSGKVITCPSDNPVGAVRVMGLRTTIQQQEQYANNMRDAKAWLDTSEAALGRATAILQRGRDLAVYGANGTLAPEDKAAMAEEVDQLINELVQVANSNFEGRYIFGGQYTRETPFTRSGVGASEAVSYAGNDGKLQWEVSPGVTVAANVSGQEAFQVDAATASKTFQVLINLRKALQGPGDPGDSLKPIDEQIDHLLSVRASLGARSQRMEMGLDRVSSDNINLTGIQSQLEDVDLAEVTMNYAMQENVYRAALATGARTMQPSLLDFLR